MVLDTCRFSRCAKVDGPRLEGIWTSFSDPRDPTIDRLPAGGRPVLHFTRDGRLVDEGVFAAFLTSYGDGPAGPGTYEVRDHSLVLHYAVGHTWQVAFSGMLSGDPAVRNDIIIYIGRGRFNRRK